MMTNGASTATEKPAAAEQGALVAPEKAASTKAAKPKKGAPKGQKAAKTAKSSAKPAAKAAAKKNVQPASKKAAKPSAPREGSKKQIIIDLMQRKEGATMAEIAKATGWQNHSIRGFVSGTLTKKMGLKIESTKNEAGERAYRIEK